MLMEHITVHDMAELYDEYGITVDVNNGEVTAVNYPEEV